MALKIFTEAKPFAKAPFITEIGMLATRRGTLTLALSYASFVN
jgi:hypothetical protein